MSTRRGAASPFAAAAAAVADRRVTRRTSDDDGAIALRDRSRANARGPDPPRVARVVAVAVAHGVAAATGSGIAMTIVAVTTPRRGDVRAMGRPGKFKYLVPSLPSTRLPIADPTCSRCVHYKRFSPTVRFQHLIASPFN